MTRILCTLAVVLGTTTLTGCSEELDARSPDLGDEVALQLGRVHVVVDRTDVGPMDEDSFASFVEVSARFAYVRGFDEEFARSHADIPMLASDILRPGQCVPTDQLTVDDGPADTSTDGRELVLLDAGEVTVEVGPHRIQVPVSLVPDLLPYMSGVEYLYLSDATSEPVVEVSGPDLTVHVTAEGTLSDELADFSAEGRVPAPPVLGLQGSLDSSRLALTWDGETGTAPIIVTVASLAGGEPAGTEITCVFEDVGHARIDASTLRLQGLDPSLSDGLSLEASRLHRTTFDAGEFVGAELVVEARDSIIVDPGQ